MCVRMGVGALPPPCPPDEPAGAGVVLICKAGERRPALLREIDGVRAAAAGAVGESTGVVDVDSVESTGERRGDISGVGANESAVAVAPTVPVAATALKVAGPKAEDLSPRVPPYALDATAAGRSPPLSPLERRRRLRRSGMMGFMPVCWRRCYRARPPAGRRVTVCKLVLFIGMRAIGLPTKF